MKILILSFMFLASPLSFANSDCSQIETDFLEILQKRAAHGLVSRLDVKAGQINELQAKFACREINKQKFCLEAIPAAVELTTLITLSNRDGIHTAQDVISAQKNLREIRALCK